MYREEKKDNENKNNNDIMKLGSMLILFCLVPLVLLMGLPLLGLEGGKFFLALFFLSHLLYVGMILKMNKTHKREVK